MCFTPVLSAFRRMQRSFNVPQTVGSLRKPCRGHESTTPAEKSFRYVQSRFNAIVLINFNFLYFSVFFLKFY